MKMWQLWFVVLMIGTFASTSLCAQDDEPEVSHPYWRTHQNFVGLWGSYGYSLQKNISTTGYNRISPKEFPATYLPVVCVGVAFESAEVENKAWRGWPRNRWEKIEPSWFFQCAYTYTHGSLQPVAGSLPAVRIGVGDTVMLPAVFKADVSTSILQFDILRKYRTGWISPFYIAIGGTVGWAISGAMQQNAYLQSDDHTARLLPIEGAALDDQGHRVVLKEEAEPMSNTFRVGLKAGLLYEIKVPPSGYSSVNALTFVPTLWIEYPVVNVQGEYSWKTLSGHIGLSILFAIDNPFVYSKDYF